MAEKYTSLCISKNIYADNIYSADFVSNVMQEHQDRRIILEYRHTNNDEVCF